MEQTRVTFHVYRGQKPWFSPRLALNLACESGFLSTLSVMGITPAEVSQRALAGGNNTITCKGSTFFVPLLREPQHAPELAPGASARWVLHRSTVSSAADAHERANGGPGRDAHARTVDGLPRAAAAQQQRAMAADLLWRADLEALLVQLGGTPAEGRLPPVPCHAAAASQGVFKDVPARPGQAVLHPLRRVPGRRLPGRGGRAGDDAQALPSPGASPTWGTSGARWCWPVAGATACTSMVTPARAPRGSGGPEAS